MFCARIKWTGYYLAISTSRIVHQMHKVEDIDILWGKIFGVHALKKEIHVPI